MKTENLQLKDRMKKTMPAHSETTSMHILSNCEDIDLIDDLLPAAEDLEQFIITL